MMGDKQRQGWLVAQMAIARPYKTVTFQLLFPRIKIRTLARQKRREK